MNLRNRLTHALSPATTAIALTCIALVAVIWTITLNQLARDHERVLANESSKNTNLVQSQGERSTRSLQLLDQLLLFLRTDYLTHRSAPNSINDILKSMNIDRSYVGIVAILGPNGESLATTSDVKTINYKDRGYFQIHAKDPTDRLLIGQPIIGRVTGQWIVTLTRRITLADGSFGGVVFMALNPNFLAFHDQKGPQSGSGSLALIGLDGITRTRRNGDKISFGEDVRTSQLFKEIPKAKTGCYVGVAASDKQRRLACYQVMDSYPMVTVVASSLKDIDALAQQHEQLYKGTALASSSLVVALAALSISMLLRRRRTLAAIEDSERRYRLLFETSLDAVVSLQVDGRVMGANPAACAMFGLPAGQWTAVSSAQLLDQDDPRTPALMRTLATQGRALGALRMLRSDGSAFEAEVSATSGPGDTSLRSMIIRDVTERKQAEDQIRTLAFYDPLTRLPNRRLLMDRLQMTLAASNRQQRLAALLFIDLDNFKILNDTLGHHQGDLLLQQVATRLLTCVRESDTCARLGGDEFVVMLNDLGASPLDAASQAELIGRKVLLALNQSYTLATRSHHSSPSIGITLFGGGQDESIDEPLKRADLAMYQAKTAGRNTLRFFDPEIQAAMAARAALELGLREAVVHQQFVLHYQPQVQGEGRITGAEVLVRWMHPERGMVSPAEFIPLAEDTGLILPLGQWVLETACAQLAAWAEHPQFRHLTVSVNVSERQFQEAEFVDQILRVLVTTGAPASQLKLELTEGLLVTEVEDVIAKMTALKARGVGFSLDDFGTGYSSLSYLKRLPLDQLKIDQSFVRDILVDPNDAAISKMVIVLAESLGLTVIAEGVETESQRAMLEKQGCHAYQGYLFSRPVTLQAFEDLLRASATAAP